jgi:hypothetical protein
LVSCPSYPATFKLLTGIFGQLDGIVVIHRSSLLPSPGVSHSSPDCRAYRLNRYASPHERAVSDRLCLTSCLARTEQRLLVTDGRLELGECLNK